MNIVYSKISLLEYILDMIIYGWEVLLPCIHFMYNLEFIENTLYLLVKCYVCFMLMYMYLKDSIYMYLLYVCYAIYM